MKRPIDLQREGAAFMNVGSPDDTSPITGMVVIGKMMNVIKADSIYEVRLADEIDPNRTNPSIPNTQQKILSVGSESEVVGRILLTARNLFKATYLPKNINCDEALQLSLEILKDIVAMSELCASLKEDERVSMAGIKDNRTTDRSVLLPSIKNLHHGCAGFVQKADHALSKLYSVALIFFPKARKPFFEGFSETLIVLYGNGDPFAQCILGTIPFLKFVRATRNCIEHPKRDQRIVVRDFSFEPSGEISLPSIEVIHGRSPHPAISISAFMGDITASLIDVTEGMIAGICSKRVDNSHGGAPFEVVELPEPMRQAKFVRYSYGIIDQSGGIIPAS